jgi:hypothetical protein
VRSPGLREMFFYPEWLQTTPPLFLILERATVSAFGTGNTAWRIMPLALAGLAAVAMWRASRRILPWPFAAAACALLVSNAGFVEYSHTLKQYSGEVAVSAGLIWTAGVFFERRSAGSFVALLAVLACALPLAYSTAFFLPGLLAALGIGQEARRAVLLAVCCTLELAALYFFMVLPNYSPELLAFWSAQANIRPVQALGAALCLAMAPWLWRRWWFWLTAVPFLLDLAAIAVRVYPASVRTQLFTLPCVLILAAEASQRLFARALRFRSFGYFVCAVAASLAIYGVRLAVRTVEPEEDYAGAVSFLKQRASVPDLILVHAAAREGFQLYADLQQWMPPRLAFGATGWPCCARGRDAWPGRSREARVMQDVDRLIPAGFRGRIWLLYPTRPSHWDYVGLNEGDLWRHHVWDRGCPPGLYFKLPNLAVSEMVCAP